jgi:hypothetical protein
LNHLGCADSLDCLYPAYIRGLAYLESGDGRSATGEFQKLSDNPGLCWGYNTGPLTRLQLGRTEKLTGDNAAAREFLKSGKMPTPMFPPIDKPEPSTPSSENAIQTAGRTRFRLVIFEPNLTSVSTHGAEPGCDIRTVPSKTIWTDRK